MKNKEKKMASSSRISLSDLNPRPLTGPQNKVRDAETKTSEQETLVEGKETEEVLEVEAIETSKVNDATEPAQAIINSLSVNPDLEKATRTKKRRTKKSIKTTSAKSKKKASTKSRSASSKKTKN